MRPRRAYYLDITYPEGSHDEAGLPTVGWFPQRDNSQSFAPWTCWDEIPLSYVKGDRFKWPIIRTYLTRAGAENRARKFTQYGCTVEIQESDLITWGKNSDPEPRPRRYRNPVQTVELLQRILRDTGSPETSTTGTNQEAQDD